jgi:hypothetical protein
LTVTMTAGFSMPMIGASTLSTLVKSRSAMMSVKLWKVHGTKSHKNPWRCSSRCRSSFHDGQRGLSTPSGCLTFDCGESAETGHGRFCWEVRLLDISFSQRESVPDPRCLSETHVTVVHEVKAAGGARALLHALRSFCTHAAQHSRTTH